jgi:hypothetical protein
MKTRYAIADRTIPKIGETWRAKGYETEYVRINDVQGARALGMEPGKDYIFSVRKTDWKVTFACVKMTDFEIVEPRKPRLPEVGEAWMHRYGGTVYIRIDDEKGANAVSLSEADLFFSVDPSTGMFAFTRRNSVDDIVPLKATSVDSDGTVVFTEA